MSADDVFRGKKAIVSCPVAKVAKRVEDSVRLETKPWMCFTLPLEVLYGSSLEKAVR